MTMLKCATNSRASSVRIVVTRYVLHAIEFRQSMDISLILLNTLLILMGKLQQLKLQPLCRRDSSPSLRSNTPCMEDIEWANPVLAGYSL